jgi:general stress protein YciG
MCKCIGLDPATVSVSRSAQRQSSSAGRYRDRQSRKNLAADKVRAADAGRAGGRVAGGRHDGQPAFGLEMPTSAESG